MSVTERSNDRLLFLLETVEKEGRHLIGTTARLFAETVDAAWVKRLEDQPAPGGRAAHRRKRKTDQRSAGVSMHPPVQPPTDRLA